MIYSHQKCVWVVRSGCESSAKASDGWDTSEIEGTGGPGRTEYSTYTLQSLLFYTGQQGMYNK